MSIERNHPSTGQRPQSPSPQLIGTSQKKTRRVTSQATGLNQHVRDAVIRLAFDSCLEIKQLSRVAKYAGTRESIALDVIRQYVRDLRAGGHFFAQGGSRRAAA